MGLLFQPPFEGSTLVELLRWRASGYPGQRVYTYQADEEAEEDSLTFAELDRQARRIGALLQTHAHSGERALLIYPAGLEFITALFGCLYSGIIAVPVYPSLSTRSDNGLAKFLAISKDAKPLIALTTSSLAVKVGKVFEKTQELQTIRLLTTDDAPPEDGWREADASGSTLALLQYTSGSTGKPKGVMLTHGNLLHNSSLIYRCCEHKAENPAVTWLPLYHDLGLVGGVLQPLYSGCRCTIMSPTAFLQSPVRWLQAITRERATLSAGPNFAYDLCVRKITPEQRATLDLSSWLVAINGAEPIRKETLERFSAAFEPCGFRRETFYPCYGLAEATLIASGGQVKAKPIIRMFHGAALEQNRIVEVSVADKETRVLVGCGQSLMDQKIVIADPESLTQCPTDQVGEVWIAGPSVTQGYWNKPEETERV